MNEIENNIDIKSFYEILQDNFCLTLLEGIINSFKDIEAQNAIEELIAEFSPIFIHEAYLFLKEKNLVKADNFYKSKELKNKIKSYRMIATKEQIKQSDYIKEITEKMGIKFNDNVFDINIIVNKNMIKRFNFSVYNKREDSEFFRSSYATNIDFAEATLNAIIKIEYGLNEISKSEYNDIIKFIINERSNDVKLLEKNLKGVRYSYKSSKIFKYSNIEDNDKFFILYRFNILKTIIELKKFFEKNNTTIAINENVIVNCHKFINKIMALEIAVLGQDIQSLDTTYMNKLQNDLDKKILKLNYNFYPLNRKLRNNIHYSLIEELDEDVYKDVTSIQVKYLKFVYHRIYKEIYFELDEDDIKMNEFLKYCNENNIEKDEIDRHYANYYYQYYYTKQILRNK